MSSGKRREQLLKIANDLYSEARNEAEFTMEVIAKRGEVSTVWAYKLIGPEYAKLRERLRNRRGAVSKAEHQQRKKISDLTRRLRETEAKYVAETTGDYGAAIRYIEALEEENRGIRGLLKIYARRLADAGLIIEPLGAHTADTEEEQQRTKDVLNESNREQSDMTIDSENIIESLSDYSN